MLEVLQIICKMILRYFKIVHYAQGARGDTPGRVKVKMSLANKFGTKLFERESKDLPLPKEPVRFKIPGMNWREWGMSYINWYMDFNEIKSMRNRLFMRQEYFQKDYEPRLKKLCGSSGLKTTLGPTHCYEGDADGGDCWVPTEHMSPGAQVRLKEHDDGRGSSDEKTRALGNCGQGHPSQGTGPSRRISFSREGPAT